MNEFYSLSRVKENGGLCRFFDVIQIGIYKTSGRFFFIIFNDFFRFYVQNTFVSCFFSLFLLWKICAGRFGGLFTLPTYNSNQILFNKPSNDKYARKKHHFKKYILIYIYTRKKRMNQIAKKHTHIKLSYK